MADLVTKDEAIAILQEQLDGIEQEMRGWVERMHQANKPAFEKFCNDVIELRVAEFFEDWAGIGGLLVLAKGSLLAKLIEHERALR